MGDFDEGSRATQTIRRPDAGGENCKALYRRHERLVAEMGRRGYRHKTPLPAEQATGLGVQEDYKDSPAEQVAILQGKGCGCRV